MKSISDLRSYEHLPPEIEKLRQEIEEELRKRDEAIIQEYERKATEKNAKKVDLFKNHKDMKLADQLAVFGTAALRLEEACESGNIDEASIHVCRADKVMEGVDCPEYWKLREVIGLYLAIRMK